MHQSVVAIRRLKILFPSHYSYYSYNISDWGKYSRESTCLVVKYTRTESVFLLLTIFLIHLFGIAFMIILINLGDF